MLQQQFAHDAHVNGMGYGFMWSTQNGKELLWHTWRQRLLQHDDGADSIGRGRFLYLHNTPIGDLYQPLVSFVDHFYPAAPAAAVAAPADTAQRIAALQGSYVSSRVAHTSDQKFVTWQAEALTVQAGANDTLLVGTRTYRETEPGLFQQVDGPRTLTYRTNEEGQVAQIFWGQFAYVKVPWYQTAINQLLMAAIALLIMLTAGLASAVDWFVRRRRGGATAGRWAVGARWAAVALGLLNSGLLVWFVVALLGFADTFVFPTKTVTLLTWLWAINLPALLVILFFTVKVWVNHDWRPAWRIHYTLAALAGVLFLGFLINWHLLPV
ncbi:MAG: hypothetical protein R2867_44220 [Caldilineaceae bacterium]